MLRLPDHVQFMWPDFPRVPPEWLQADVATALKRANTDKIARAITTPYIINHRISVIFDSLYRHPVFCRREELNEYWVPHKKIDMAEDWDESESADADSSHPSAADSGLQESE